MRNQASMRPTGFRLTHLLAMAILMALAVSHAAAQRPPAQDGLRFTRPAEKIPASLAPKAGGPTERIEIQSTEDHIDYVVKTYVLKQANAAEVYELISQAVEKEGGRVSRIAPGSVVEANEKSGEVKTANDGESMLVVTAPEWMIAYLDQTIQTLDRKGLSAAALGTGALYAHIEHRLPSEVAELIRQTSASPYIVLKPDDTRQLLYIEDTPSYFGADLEALRVFDAPPPQIETRVRIYELKESDSDDVGVDWNAWKKSIGEGALTLKWDGKPGSYNVDLQSLSAELSFTPQLATEFLNYLVSHGHAKVVTDSCLTQINSQAAVVRSVLQVPYVICGNAAGGQGNNMMRQDSPNATDCNGMIKEFTEGVIVEMTPRIGAEIELAVKASVSSHVGYTPNQSVPLITESQVETVALLAPGRPAVLGGLSRETRVNERSGVVGLRSIPGLRPLFSREVERKQKNHIIVTIELDKVLAGEGQGMRAALAPRREK